MLSKAFSSQVKQVTIEIISFLFIILFIYAALNKAIDYQKFEIQIGQSPLLLGLGHLVPWLVIGIELITSGLLMSRRFRTFGLYFSFSLMTMFTAYIFAILNFSDDVPCSCGGVLETLGWTEHLIFNIVFVFLAVIGILFQAMPNNSPSQKPPGQTTQAYVKRH